ncbi:hypothetical protein APR41_17480, partial [Salegentibacter salinarum]
MKHNYFFRFSFLLIFFLGLQSSLNAQATISFDDQGFAGCSVISDNHNFSANGKTFNIFAANFDGSPSASGSLWYETGMPENCWSSWSTEFENGGYIVAGYAEDQSSQEWYAPEALVIKTIDGSEFKFSSFKAHDTKFDSWGNYLKISGYKDGVLQGSESVVIVSDVEPYHSTVTLTDPIFDSVDEVRITMDKDNNPEFGDPGTPDSNAEGLFHSFDTFVVDNAVQSTFDGGDGTELAPYQVETAEQLDAVRDYLEAHFIQTADIDLGVSPWSDGEGWVPIGTASGGGNFKGTYDGNGYTISNLSIGREESMEQGLFGVTSSATLKNIAIENATVSAKSYVGLLVGNGSQTTISNSYATGSVTGTDGNIGGLVGAFTMMGNEITNSNASATVNGRSDVGGLVGSMNDMSEITSSYASGTVTGTDYSIGGLVGSIQMGGNVTNSYASASVHGGQMVGGLVGFFDMGNITNSYTTGEVTGIGSDVGGLVGMSMGNVTSSFWDTETTGQNSSSGGTGKSTTEMKEASTFTDAGWDFDAVWHIGEPQGSNNTYPYLQNNTQDPAPGYSGLQSPEVVTNTTFENITSESAIVSGNVTNDGGDSVTERGFVYGTSSNPTIADNKVQVGIGTGEFSEAITGLSSETTYYVRAYAINGEGTSYGSEESFTTSAPAFDPVQSLYWPNEGNDKIEGVSLTGSSRQDIVTIASSGSIIAIDIDQVNEKAYWFDQTDSKIYRSNLDGTSIEEFVSNPGYATTIFVDHVNEYLYWPNYEGSKIERIKLDGTGREDVISATDPIGISVDVSGSKVYWYDQTNGSIYRGNLEGSGSEEFISNPGYATTVYIDQKNNHLYWPNNESSKIERIKLDGTGREDVISATDPIGISVDVSGSKVYWYDQTNGSIYRGNLDGSGSEEFISNPGYATTLSIPWEMPAHTLPSVATSLVSTITATGATLSSEVTSDGGESVTERGFVYATSASPTTADNKVKVGTGTGAFSQALTGLTAETTYYVRAYAINSEGTSYGSEEIFTTPAIPVPPTFTSAPSTVVEYGELYSYSITATSVGELATTISATTIPDWLTLSAETQSEAAEIGEIPGTATLSGTALDDNGNIYAITYSGTTIYKIEPDGTTSVWATGLINGDVHALHVAGDYLYIPRYANSAQAITRIPLENPGAGEEVFASFDNGAISLTDYGDWIYAAVLDRNEIKRIHKSDKTAETFLTTEDGILGEGPFGLDVDTEGNLFIATLHNHTILKYDGTDITTAITNLPNAVTSVVVNESGNFYVSMLNGGVRKYKSDWSDYSIVSQNETDNVISLSITSTGELAYSLFQTNHVYQFKTSPGIAGIPAKSDVGTHEVILKATNDAGSVQQTFSIEVKDNVTPVVHTYIPANNTTDVEIQPTLSISFDEEVVLGSQGTLTINNGTTILRTYDLEVPEDRNALAISGDNLTLSFDLDRSLPVNTAITVGISAGFVEDQVGNEFEGFTPGFNTWSFTTMKKLDQNINFPEISAKTYGGDEFILGDEFSDKGLKITYEAADSGIIEITGNKATILKAGNTTITAAQEGDEETLPAEPISRDLSVSKKDVVVSANELPLECKEPAENFSFEIEGLVYEDEPADLDNTDFEFLTTYEVGNGTGTYDLKISVGNAQDDNYNFTGFNPSTVNVVDTTPAEVITQNITVYLDENGAASIIPEQIDNGSNDDCGIADLKLDDFTFSCSDLGANTVKLIVEDVNGNFAEATATVTVKDNHAPVVNGQNFTLQLNENGIGVVNPEDILPGIFDNCTTSPIVSLGENTFTCEDIGKTGGWEELTATATSTYSRSDFFSDISGIYMVGYHSGTATVNLMKWEDSDWKIISSSPLNFRPNYLSLSRHQNGNFLVGATDPNNKFFLYAYNANSIQWSGLITENNNSQWNLSSTYDPADFATNPVNNEIWLTFLPSSGPAGTYKPIVLKYDGTAISLVGYPATGITNEWSVYSQITFTLDGTATVIFGARNNKIGPFLISYVNNQWIDRGPVAGIQDLSYFLDILTSNTGVIYMAFEENTAGKTSLYRTTDFINYEKLNEQPGRSNSLSLSSLNSGQVYYRFNEKAYLIDNSAVIEFEDPIIGRLYNSSLVENPDGGYLLFGNKSSIGSSRAYKFAKGNSLNYSVTDDSGNTTTGSVEITVEDNIAPEVVTNDITVELDENGTATINAEMIDDNSLDACGIESRSLDITEFDCSNVGKNTIKFTVTDVNGNQSTAEATVTVVDNITPTAIGQDVTIYLDENGQASTTAEAINNNSTDNCEIESLSLSKTQFDCSNVGENTVILTVVDTNENESTAEATVTVFDNIAPTAIAQNITVQLDA